MATGFTLDELNAMAAQPQQASRGYSLEELDALAAQPQTSQKGYSLEELEAMSAQTAPAAPVVTQETPAVAQPEPAGPVVAQETPAAPPIQEAPVAEQVPPAAPAQPTAEQAPQAQPAPGMFDRVLNFLNQPVPVSGADKLIAGSLKKGFKQLGQVPAATEYAELSGLQNAREKEYGKNLENAPPEVKARHEETAKRLMQLQQDAAVAGVERKQIEAEFGVNPLAKKLEELSSTPEYQEGSFWDKTKKYGSALLDNAKDIPGYIGTLGLESLPASTATIATALLTRGLTKSNTLAAASAGGTSGFIEFGNNYADMREKGMSHEEAWEKAAVKSGVIGFFDAVSFGSAGKAANEVMKKVEQGAALAATKQTVKGSTIQGAYGAAGEGGGSAVIGEDLDPVKMGAEFAGEFFTAPIEGAGAYAGYKQAAQTPPAQPTAEPKTAEQIQAERANFDALSAEYQSMMAEAQKYPADSVENQEATQRAFDFFDANIAPLIETPVVTETLEVTPPTEEIVTSTAPGISVSYPRERTEPTFTVDPETGEVIPAPAAPIEAESNPIIERRALELRQVNGYPAEVALSVARREFAEGDLNVESLSGEQPGAEAVAGRIEPSISVPSEGATTTEGVAPLDTDRLDGVVGTAGEPVVGAGAQRTALDESLIPTLTERAPAPVPPPTYAQLPAEDKAPVLEEAQQMWQAGEANLPMAKAWNSLPSWKRDMFAAQVYENYDEITTNPEVFRAAMDKVIEAKKPADAEAVVTKVEAPAAPVVQTPTAPVLSEEDQARLRSAQRNAEEAQATLDFLAERGFTTPEQNYGVEAAQNKLVKAQGVINELQPPVTTAPVEQAQAKLADAEAAVAAATTPEAKKEAAAQRNIARQEAKRAAAAPAATPALQDIPQNILNLHKKYERMTAMANGRIPAEPNAKGVSPRPQDLKREETMSFRRLFSAVQNLTGDKSGEPNAPTMQMLARLSESSRAENERAEAAIPTPTAPKRGRPAKPKVEGAEPKTPKPRGRRKIELTPEEQVTKAAKRKASQAESNKASRLVDKLINIVTTPFDADKYETDAQAKVALAQYDFDRRDAIYSLNKYTEPTSPFRDSKNSGLKARGFLANSDKITRKERADLQTRLEFEKTRPPKPSAARAKSSGKVNPALYNFKTATQAIDHIARNGTPFERALAARLKPFVSDVRLVVADTKENTPEGIQDLISDASGVYSSRRYGDKIYRMIVLRGENFDDPDMQGVNNTIFLHEALHAATEAKIDEAQELADLGMPLSEQLQTLMSDLLEIRVTAQTRYDQLKKSGAKISPNLRHKFEKLGIAANAKEFVAYGMSDPDVQQFLLTTPGYTSKAQALDYIKNLFNRFVNSLRRAFNMKDSDQSALQDLMLVTEGLLQEQEIEPAQSVNTVLEAKEKKVDKNLEKIRLSPDSKGMVDPIEENVKAGHTYNDFNDLMQARLDAMGNGFIRKTLATLQTADIIRWQGDAIPALKSIDTLVEKMAGSRMNMERAFTKKADQFARFVRRVGKKKQLLADAMHLARLNSVSPTSFKDRADALATDKRMVQLDKLLANPATLQEELPTINSKRTIRKKQINQTFDAWEKLGTLKGGQDMYRMVRQFYKDANVLTRTLLDERIERLNVEGSIDDPSTPKGRLMLAVRRMQEDSDFKGIDEYFPFMRYGNFWLRVNGPQGREFYLFESGTERNTFLKRRAKELGVDPNAESDTFDAGDDLTALRTKYSPESKMLADMFETIDNEMDKPGVDKDALKDALYQTYLMTLPEESYRKQFLHAENVTGFSSDVFRNFTTSASRIASQSAKLAYGDQISAEVQRARDTLKRMPVLMKAKLELFVNEINSRVQDELNPEPESKAVTRINQFAYYSLLTGVASAITQTTALPMLVMPVLNQEYGYGSSAAKFAKYMALWQSVGVTQEGADGEVVYTAPTMGESRIVKSNPILQRAFQEAIERGLTAQTNSSVLTNRNRTPDSAYSNIPRAALRTTATMMSSLFTGAERMTREMAYLMTFELEYAKTKDFDASVQKAVDTVQELLGRYDAFNRPRIMRNVVGRTVGQFKMYAVNITSFFIRNGYNMATQAFKGNPKEALNAMHRLGGVLTMAAVFGGVTSFPMYSLVTSVIDLMLDAFGDDEEKKRRMAENPYTASSSDLRFRYEFLPQMFGDIKITGLDGKSRTLAAVLEKGAISELGDFNIGSRTTYDGMWFRDAKPGNTTQETVVNYLVANLGPAVSSGLSMTGAVDDFSNGKIARGLERIAPALFKNPLTAARLAKEGAKTPKGDVVMSKEEFSSFNLAMQALGFQSTALARYQENKFKLQQETIAATKTRSDILGKLDNAILDNDASDKDLDRVFDRIDKFNDRYMAMKHLRIGSDTIKRVLDRAKEKEGFMFRGMYIRKEDLPYLLELRDTTERPQ